MSTSPGPELLEVGRIGKAHGLAGDLLVDFVTDRVEERTRAGATLWAGDRQLVVVSARLHTNRWLMRFEDVHGRVQAEALTGTVLLAVPVEDPDAVFVHQLIGRRLIDQRGTDHGSVVAVLANPASDLLELESGRLVPLTFLVELGDDGTVVVDVPVGLLDDDQPEA